MIDNTIKVGDIFQRNDFQRDGDTPNYIMIVTYNDGKYTSARRLKYHNYAEHEETTWPTKDILSYFKKIK